MQTRFSFCKTTFILCGFLVLVSAVLADNWPRFRGPNGTGLAENQKIPTKWNKINILWKTALPGLGNSSPVIWEDHLFIQSASKDGSQRMLICLNAKTGKQLWSREAPGSTAKTHAKNTLASSTPATDGQRVYACFWDGSDLQMVAYDFAGKELWNRDLGKFISQHGAGASPIPYKDRVFFLNDQDGKAALLALDAKTGNTLWEAPRPHERACYGSPFLWERNGELELVVITTHEFTGYNPDTGKENWSWTWKHTGKMPLRVTGSPVAVGNMLFSGSGDGGGARTMVAIEVNGNGKTVETDLLWTLKKDTPYVPSLLTHGDHLYFVNDAGFAGCYHARSGERVWYERVSEADFTASPVLIDGKIYAPNEAGEVYVLAASPKFEFLARNSLGEMVRASPAVANQRLYIRGKNHLFCIGQAQ